jgi:hypothetical protein
VAVLLIQPPDLPEHSEWSGTPGVPVPEALPEYERCFDEATIHVSCEDYRAGATIDLAHDDADADATEERPEEVAAVLTAFLAPAGEG